MVTETDRPVRIRDEWLDPERRGHGVGRTGNEATGDPEFESSGHGLRAVTIRGRACGSAKTSMDTHSDLCPVDSATDAVDQRGRAHVEELIGEVRREHDG